MNNEVIRQLDLRRSNPRKSFKSDLSEMYKAGIPYSEMKMLDVILNNGVQLFEYQKKALWFMYEREKNYKGDLLRKHIVQNGFPIWRFDPQQHNYVNSLTLNSQKQTPSIPRGGILADEMGLGKTITTIGLLQYSHTTQHNPPLETLIICPKTLLGMWQKELQRCAPAVVITLEHGPQTNTITQCSRASLVPLLVTLTTYGTFVNRDNLMKKKWFRTVLDEGHEIRNNKRKRAEMICDSISKNSHVTWILSGTPFVNGVSDLYSYFKILNLSPVDDMIYFNRLIKRPMDNNNRRGLEHANTCLRTIMLRRMKSEIKDLVLPEKNDLIVDIELNKTEQDIHTKLVEFAYKISGEKDGGKQTLVLITRFRQLCNAHTLLPTGFIQFIEKGREESEHVLVRDSQATALELFKTSDDEDEACAVCLESLSGDEKGGVIMLPGSLGKESCGHIFHKSCIDDVVKHSHSVCPLCRTKFDSQSVPYIRRPKNFRETAESHAGKESNKITYCSSKMVKIAEICRNHDWEGSIVIFSNFVSMLEALNDYLRKVLAMDDIAICCGQQSATCREKSICDFQSGNIKILLCSLKVCGVGVTLTTGSAVVLCEPHWNTAMEQQAIDRVHRIGSKHKKITVYKLKCKKTIEEGIMLMQRNKEKMKQCSVDTSLTESQLQVYSEHFKPELFDLLSSAGIFRASNKRSSGKSEGPWVKAIGPIEMKKRKY